MDYLTGKLPDQTEVQIRSVVLHYAVGLRTKSDLFYQVTHSIKLRYNY